MVDLLVCAASDVNADFIPYRNIRVFRRNEDFIYAAAFGVKGVRPACRPKLAAKIRLRAVFLEVVERDFVTIRNVVIRGGVRDDDGS